MARPAKPITLTELELTELTAILKKGTHKSRKITRAKALLLMHSGKSQADIALALGIDRNHYFRIKQRYLAGGLAQSLEELPRSGQPAKVTARLEAQITSLACSDAPPGAACWTLSLINEKLIELAYVETISNETIRQVLKKATANPGNNRCGASAP